MESSVADVVVHVEGVEENGWLIHSDTVLRVLGLGEKFSVKFFGSRNIRTVVKCPWRDIYEPLSTEPLKRREVISSVLEVLYFFTEPKKAMRRSSPPKLAKALSILTACRASPEELVAVLCNDIFKFLVDTQFLQPTHMQSPCISEGSNLEKLEHQARFKIAKEERHVILKTVYTAMHAVCLLLEDTEHQHDLLCDERICKAKQQSTDHNSPDKHHQQKHNDSVELEQHRKYSSMDERKALFAGFGAALEKVRSESTGLGERLVDAESKIGRLCKLLELKAEENINLGERLARLESVGQDQALSERKQPSRKKGSRKSPEMGRIKKQLCAK